MPDTAARPRRISDESSSRVLVRCAATRFAARSPPASSRRTVSHLVRSRDRTHHSNEKEKNTRYHHARSHTRRPTARRRYPPPRLRLPRRSASKEEIVIRSVGHDPIRKTTNQDWTETPSDPRRLRRFAFADGSNRVTTTGARAVVVVVVDDARRDAMRDTRAYLFLDSSRARGRARGRARAARESRPASTRIRRRLGVGVSLSSSSSSAGRPIVSRQSRVVIVRAHRHRSRAHRLASRASRASSSIASPTSGRNARKPSNKSSCPARHRRTLSTTTSAVNLRLRG